MDKLLDGQLTIICSAEGVEIELRDKNSFVVFLQLSVSSEDFVAALGRRAEVPCQFQLRGTNVVGKKSEHKSIEIPLHAPGELFDWHNKKHIARNIIFDMKQRGEFGDWEPKYWLSSQDSFFIRDGVEYVKERLVRYVDVEENEVSVGNEER